MTCPVMFFNSLFLLIKIPKSFCSLSFVFSLLAFSLEAELSIALESMKRDAKLEHILTLKRAKKSSVCLFFFLFRFQSRYVSSASTAAIFWQSVGYIRCSVRFNVGGTIYTIGLLFCQFWPIDIHRRGLWAVSVEGPSSVEYIIKNFSNFVSTQGVVEVYSSCKYSNDFQHLTDYCCFCYHFRYF